VLSINEMRQLAYPNPRGTYFCFSIEEIEDSGWSLLLTTRLVEELRSERTAMIGAPVSVTWLEVVSRI
jgi:hypothetical protein